MSDPSQSILIIGAGVFGLSTALFLARRGYKDVTVVDRVSFHKTHYNPSAGCDGASADINKVFRTGYGDRKMYERLAYKALPVWQEWTKAVHESRPQDLPEGLNPEDSLLVLCGVMRLGEGKQISQYYRDILDGVDKDGRRGRVFVLSDENDHLRAIKEDEKNPGMSWSKKLHRYGALHGGNIHGMLDMDTGFTRADKCCVYALHLCKQAGVKFILDEKAGRFERFIKKGQSVLGVITSDGQEHRADKTVVACGAWTASVVPEAGSLLETTAGSLCFVDIPRNRPDLLKRFGPEEFCGWSLKLESCGNDVNAYRSVGGFPADPSGRLKFGFRAVKYTNYETHPSGARLSVPRTKYSHNPIQNIPKEALEAMKSNIIAIYPELAEIGITDTRLCWYTDTIDNHFVGDYVPNTNDTLFIASGGSGHGFKFLPVLGEYFVNGLEKKEDEFTQYWKWRTPKPGEWANGLEEGELGPRVLNKVEIATRADWRFDIPAMTRKPEELKA